MSASKDLASSAIFAALTAIGAIFAIPLPAGVPITMQTFFTYLSGAVLGAKRGALSQAIYVAIGIAGLPVFAGFSSGPGVLLGPTGGYLIGFIAGAYITGAIADIRRGHGAGRVALSMVIATAAIYVLGLSQLTNFLIQNVPDYRAFDKAFPYAVSGGVIPFLVGDGLKLLTASIIATNKSVVSAAIRFLPMNRTKPRDVAKGE